MQKLKIRIYYNKFKTQTSISYWKSKNNNYMQYYSEIGFVMVYCIQYNIYKGVYNRAKVT